MRKMIAKVKLAAALAVVCILVFHDPFSAAAQNQEIIQQPGQEESEQTPVQMESTLPKTENEEFDEGNVNGRVDEAEPVEQQDNKETTGEEQVSLSETEEKQAEESEQQTETENSELQNETNPETEPAAQYLAVAALMNESDENYGDLSRFLSLSADQFQIYTVAVLDAATAQPAISPIPLSVSFDFPNGYDETRLAVCEVKMQGETPARTEIEYTIDENGKILIHTEHTGVFVVMEKKVQQNLPAYLKPTDKITKLELQKTGRAVSDEIKTLKKSGVSGTVINPQTGDDHSVFVWGLVTGTSGLLVAAGGLMTLFRKRK